jgi:hypothetical protein
LRLLALTSLVETYPGTFQTEHPGTMQPAHGADCTVVDGARESKPPIDLPLLFFGGGFGLLVL